MNVSIPLVDKPILWEPQWSRLKWEHCFAQDCLNQNQICFHVLSICNRHYNQILLSLFPPSLVWISSSIWKANTAGSPAHTTAVPTATSAEGFCTAWPGMACRARCARWSPTVDVCLSWRTSASGPPDQVWNKLTWRLSMMSVKLSSSGFLSITSLCVSFIHSIQYLMSGSRETCRRGQSALCVSEPVGVYWGYRTSGASGASGQYVLRDTCHVQSKSRHICIHV